MKRSTKKTQMVADLLTKIEELEQHKLTSDNQSNSNGSILQKQNDELTANLIKEQEKLLKVRNDLETTSTELKLIRESKDSHYSELCEAKDKIIKQNLEIQDNIKTLKKHREQIAHNKIELEEMTKLYLEFKQKYEDLFKENEKQKVKMSSPINNKPVDLYEEYINSPKVKEQIKNHNENPKHTSFRANLPTRAI